jgi:DNA helicase-2/ATP-dependent DNA helicase PcrA
MLHGQTRYSLASRFLEEIPEGLKKWLTPRFARQQRNLSWSAPAKEKTFQMKRRDGGGFRVGQNVKHAKFGAGVIIDAEGDGTDARVQVNFGSAGVKWLAVAVAKLQAA